MPRKAFHIGIDLDIHAVSCPGVWLCPKGDAMLRISMLGASAHTKRVEPNFPLLFHESFHFRKTFTGITSLAELQSELTKRFIHIQLVQWQVHGCRCVLLAVFRSTLSELLYPQPAFRGLLAGVDVDLLMDTTPCFPGIIAPKVEVSTKVVIEEMVNYPLHDCESAIITHKTLQSKRTGYKRENKADGRSKTKGAIGTRLRQKPVCHAKPSVKCYSCKQRVDREHRGRVRGGSDAHCTCGGEMPKDDTHYIPYCNKCGDVVEENEVKQGKIILKEGAQHTGKWESACPCVETQSKSVCDCSLCRRYHNLFKNSCVLSPGSDDLQNPKSPKWKSDRSPSPPKNDKCCACQNEKSSDDIPRFKTVTSHSRSGCACARYSTWTDSPDDNRDNASDQLCRGPTNEEYYKLFKTDLDSHYKQLYQRVSRRNNRRES